MRAVVMRKLAKAEQATSRHLDTVRRLLQFGSVGQRTLEPTRPMQDHYTTLSLRFCLHSSLNRISRWIVILLTAFEHACGLSPFGAFDSYTKVDSHDIANKITAFDG